MKRTDSCSDPKADGGAGAEPPSVAFVLSRFPCYDESFFLRDFAAMDKAGGAFLILSIKPCRDPIVHAEAKAFLPRRIYLPLLRSWRVWWSLGLMILTRLPRLVSGVAELIHHSWPRLDFLIKGLILVPQACAYARILQRRRIGRVHALWATHPATAALLIHRLTGIPWSFSGHAHDVYANPCGLAYKLARADFAVTCAGTTRKHLLDLRPAAAPDRIHVIHHGLNTHTQYTPAAVAPHEPPLRVVSVGSLAPRKGFDRLLRAMHLLQTRRVPVHLTIVGGGPLESRLRRIATQLGLGPAVSFTGYQTQEGMAARYQAAHCFALAAVPEIHWGIPNVLAEAMACGLPVVTTRLPAVPELVEDGISGFVLPEPSPEGIARCLERLAADPALRRAMGAAGRRRVLEVFDSRRTALKWKRLLAGSEAGQTAESCSRDPLVVHATSGDLP